MYESILQTNQGNVRTRLARYLQNVCRILWICRVFLEHGEDSIKNEKIKKYQVNSLSQWFIFMRNTSQQRIGTWFMNKGFKDEKSLQCKANVALIIRRCRLLLQLVEKWKIPCSGISSAFPSTTNRKLWRTRQPHDSWIHYLRFLRKIFTSSSALRNRDEQ